MSFDETNGTFPHCNLVRREDGDFYGTTSGAGSAVYAQSVFKIGPQGKFTTIASFSGTNGGVPWDGLSLGNDGNFYGVSKAGGISNFGTVFKVSSGGKLTIMAFFEGTNGAGPVALVNGSNGDFYGTTESGGDALYMGDGTIFKMSPEGNLTTLFLFDGTNGSGPSSLCLGRDGFLYGATSGGGANNSGTVFEIINGVFRTLYEFDGTNAAQPQSVIQASDGNLYGTTYYGGVYYNGIVFKLTTNGVFSILHSFSQMTSFDENADGANPVGKLMEGRDGWIYGGTAYGGTNLFGGGYYGGIGTLFKISTNGDFITLCSFGMHTNFYGTRSFPNGLVEGKNGNFFGTTYFGGLYDVNNGGLGTIFKLITIRPIIAVTKPHQHALQSNPALTIGGKTKAKVETPITHVIYQLNAGNWAEATSADNWTNWAANVVLVPGTNVFRVYAVDQNGDASRTNILKLRLRQQ